jgi:SNF2 family DNA or RNA helicase
MTKTVPRKKLKFIKDEVEFYPHQVEGVRWLAKRSSFILADDMGLGKTLQAFVTAAVDFERGWANRVLVVCPASLKGNWYDEAIEFTNFVPHVLEGTPKKREDFLKDLKARNDWHVLIVNYEQVGAHLAMLNSMRFEIVVYDEAHYIKNPKSARTKHSHGLHGKRHFLLTGSPMLNHVDDLWSLLNRVDPGSFPNYYRFRNRYCVFGGYKDKQIIGVKNEKELTERLEHYMLRRLKKDVLDLPDKQHIPVRVDLNPLQVKLYKQVSEDMRLSIPSEPSPKEVQNALDKMGKLKQICGTTAAIEGYEDDSAKLDRMMEMVDEVVNESNEHLVVFTQYRDVLHAATNRLKKAKFITYELHGDVKPGERQGIVKEWRDGPPAVIVCMYQVAGVGLNMTKARKAFRLDKLFVPKLNEQAEDRLHRIGADKTQPVQIFDFIARNTIEQRIETILKRKDKVFRTVVDPNDLKRMLLEELRAMEESA